MSFASFHFLTHPAKGGITATNFRRVA